MLRTVRATMDAGLLPLPLQIGVSEGTVFFMAEVRRFNSRCNRARRDTVVLCCSLTARAGDDGTRALV